MIQAVPASLLRKLWYQGRLTDWMLRPHGQTWIDRFVREKRAASGRSAKPFVVNCHRRLGKSFYPLVRMVGRCIQTPGLRCVYGGPTERQVARIAEPSVQWIIQNGPEELKPKTKGREFRFRNPEWPAGSPDSILELAGLDVKHGDNVRGTFADEIVIDEAGQVRDLQYIVEDVCIPQFVGRADPFFALISTPPRNPTHPWVRHFRARAIQEGRYIEIKGSENPDFSEEDKQMVKEAIGEGEGSAAWQREVECEIIVDPKDRIIPEWDKETAAACIVPCVEIDGVPCDPTTRVPIPKPAWYVPHTIMDLGFDPDPLGAIFCFVDFPNGTLWIWDELFGWRLSNSTISREVRTRERAAFRGSHHEVRRYADGTKRDLAELSIQHKLYFAPVKKQKFCPEDPGSMIAQLRSLIGWKKVRILSRCTNTIDQLANGIWKLDANGLPVDFDRNEAQGHLDLLMALCYGVKMIDLRENPAPVGGWGDVVDLSSRHPSEDSVTLARALGFLD